MCDHKCEICTTNLLKFNLYRDNFEFIGIKLPYTYRLFGNEREFLAIVLKGRNSLSFPNSLYFILGFSLQCDNILSYDKFTNSTVDLVWFINPFRFVFYPLAMYSCAIFLAMNGKFLIFHFFVLVGSQWNWFQTHHWAQYCHTGIQANFEIIIE